MTRSQLLPIGRFARLSGISVGALRHYDELQLLVPASVNPETSYRLYDQSQLDDARLVRRLREIEMPLAEIRAVLSASRTERGSLLAAHRIRLEARAVRLQRVVHQLAQEAFMSTTAPAAIVDAETHRRLAVDLFNHVWTLLETEERTTEQEDEMVHAAHASRWHWAQTGDAALARRLAVGEWQCSRVYAVLSRPEASLHHARRSVAIAEGGDVEAWVLASAYEAMARASMVAGDAAELARWRDRARETADRIEDAEDRQVIDGDLATLP